MLPIAKIEGIAYYLPEQVVDNQQLVTEMQLEWSAEDIYSKTGIHSRHIAGTEECASDLGVKAAQQLFAQGICRREDVDFLLFCTQSPDYILPATACVIQQRLQLNNCCGALDYNQGCSGFVYGLALAKGLIESRLAKKVLLITAETYSKYMLADDRATRPIFGDGAAATLLSAAEGETAGISGLVFGTDGSGKNNLLVRGGACRELAAQRTDKGCQQNGYLYMNGAEIFQFTLRQVPQTVTQILTKSGLVMEDVDYFVFHQANAFILKHLCQKLHIPREKFYLDLEDTGNTVSASIPIALHRAAAARQISSGMRVMVLGFGVGYSWSGCIIKL